MKAWIAAGVLILGSSLAWAQDPQPAARPALLLNVPKDLQIYVNARSVVDETPEQVIARLPELKDADFSPSQEELAPLLQKVGENIEALFKDFPNTGSVEEVRQRRSNPAARTWDETSQKCLYLVSVTADSLEMRVEEYRSDSHGRPLQPSARQRAFMLTSGYVTQALLFHPLSQRGCRYRLLGRQRNTPGYILVAFAQRPEVPGPSGIMNMSGLKLTLLSQGVAWIDPETLRIARVWTDLLAPRGDFGVHTHITDCEYGEVRFENIAHPFWLPRQVEVTVKWGGETYTNRHRYSDYKIFSVDAQDGEKKLIKP